MHTTTCAAADNLQRAKRNIEGQHAVCKMQHLTFAVQQVLRPAVDQLGLAQGRHRRRSKVMVVKSKRQGTAKEHGHDSLSIGLLLY
jgi:hypothetical protein